MSYLFILAELWTQQTNRGSNNQTEESFLAQAPCFPQSAVKVHANDVMQVMQTIEQKQKFEWNRRRAPRRSLRFHEP